LLGGVAVLSVGATFISATQPPASAEVISTFTAIYTFAKNGYELYNKAFNTQPSDLVQLQAAINQSRNDIISEIDRVAAATTAACAGHVIDLLLNLDPVRTDRVEELADKSDQCVNDAQQQINQMGVGSGLDTVGFALNAVGPIALMLNAQLSNDTSLLRQHIIDGNERLRNKLMPTCAVTIDTPDNLPSSGEGRISGRGACYNYTVPAPPNVRVGAHFGGIFYLPHGPGTAFLPWTTRGLAIPEDDLIPSRGYFVNWPNPRPDYSIAAEEVMRGTSWQLAGTALELLKPTITPSGAAVAATTSGTDAAKPMQLFGTTPDDAVFSGRFSPRFSGWGRVDGSLRSVAAATNADGRAELFGVSRIGTVFHRWQQTPGNDDTWSDWARMPGVLSSLAVARNRDGTLQVFGLNPAGQLLTSHQVWGADQYKAVQPAQPAPAINTWTAWEQLDGQLAEIAAAVNTDGTIELAGITTSNTVQYRRQTAVNAYNSFNGWTALQGQSLSHIAAATDSLGRVNIVGTYHDAVFQTRHMLFDSNSFEAWRLVPGAMREVALAREADGRNRLLLIGADGTGHTFANRNDGNDGIDSSTPWDGWTDLGITLRATPYHDGPAASLFYGASDGKAAVGSVTTDGGFVNVKGIGGLDAGWTHVVNAGGGKALFYRASDGKAATAAVDNVGNFTHLKTLTGFTVGWTHIVNTGVGSLLFYRATDGLAVTATINDDGGITTQLSANGDAGWTHITTAGNGELLFYRASDGKGVTGVVDNTGKFTNQRSANGDAGWTHITTAGNGELLFYRASDGKGVTGVVDNTGKFTNQRSANGDAGWTHITTAGDNRLLFYRASDGKTVTGSVNSTGTFTNLKTINGLSTGWTQITTVQTH
jgi:hypothetical protein